MNTEGTNALKESVHEDRRELLTHKTANQRAGGAVGAFLSSVRFSSAIDLLETSAVSLTAVCLCVLLAGASLFFIQRYYIQARISADAAASALESQPGSLDEVGEGTEANGLPNSLIQYGPSGAIEAFTIRVGAFRDPSNARRVAGSLEQNSLAVKTTVRADGLHVLTLGPFAGKDAAEEAARRVHETVGLVPQVVRSNFR